jgi:hypothetical protein
MRAAREDLDGVTLRPVDRDQQLLPAVDGQQIRPWPETAGIDHDGPYRWHEIRVPWVAAGTRRLYCDGCSPFAAKDILKPLYVYRDA